MTIIRPKVQLFAAAMEGKLRDNDDKGGWHFCSRTYLKRRLASEIKELLAALKAGDPKEVTKEAADVANFAMMIADNFGDLKSGDK